jgi:glycine/D-amino acid oxidase-like deaminating enzyme
VTGRRRVAVVGGGVVGRSLARAAARAGHDVVLIDAGHEPASRVPVALLNPQRGRTGRAHPDDLAALATTWRWADELAADGARPGAHRGGVVRVADGPKQAAAFAAAGLAPVPPEVAGVRAPFGAVLVPDGGWIEPEAWLAALTGSAVDAGAALHERTRVVAVVARPQGGWRLTLQRMGDADPSSLDAEEVLLATGADPGLAAPAWGAAPEVERVAGDVVVTGVDAPPRPLAGGTYVAPVRRGDRWVAAIGGHHRPPGPPAADVAARLRTAVAWALPDLAGEGHGDERWSGVRARRASGRPEALALADGVVWVGGFAGRGFLAAAAMAERVVAELATGQPTSSARTANPSHPITGTTG